jgi:flagellar basal-body rod protein FlgF
MSEIISSVLASIQSDVARTERVASNLANAQTTGYKREIASSRPFAAQMEAAGSWMQAGPRVDAIQVDARTGTLKPTGQPLDLAIVGEGWFEVAIEQGVAYTRKGDFRLDASGRLVTQQGHPLMGVAGSIQLVHGAPVIDAEGRVFEATPHQGSAVPVAQIKVVQFERPGAIHRQGDGLVVPAGDVTAAPAGTVQVRQSMLENSNVIPMREMVELMQAVRHLESMQKVAIAYDEMLATSIRKLGEA